MTALQLQRFYLAACQQFLAHRPDAPDEAHEVVAAWEEVLDGAGTTAAHPATLPASLIGTVDWVTKKQLVDEAGQRHVLGSTQENRHLLSRTVAARVFPDAAGRRLGRHVRQPQDLDRAARTPPANSPATMRGHYIREFSVDEYRTVRQLETGRDRTRFRQQVDPAGALRSAGPQSPPTSRN